MLLTSLNSFFVENKGYAEAKTLEGLKENPKLQKICGRLHFYNWQVVDWTIKKKWRQMFATSKGKNMEREKMGLLIQT